MRPFLFLTILLFQFSSFSQETKTIHGYVSSTKTGEKLISATLYDTLHKQGAITNEYGFFSLTVKNETTVLRISSFGFSTEMIEIKKEETEFNFNLTEIQEIEEFVISSERRSIEKTNIGTMELSMDKVDKLPVLMGEKDVLKILQLMPGVKSGGEGSSGIYVRGGGPDQNLILLDGVPVYNASHLFGFFSVFNSDALSQVTLTKGAFPARYGGRVSSVLDMRMKEGNNQKFNIEGSIGVIASRILIEGPIKKDKSAFIISARRTYIDAIVKPFLPKSNKGGYYFYDLNAKFNYKINNKHHLYLSGYFGQDKAEINQSETFENYQYRHTYTDKTGLNWGNALAAIRWNYKISSKLFANTTFTYSKYLFKIYNSSEDSEYDNGVLTNSSYSFNYFSGIDDWTGKIDLTFLPNPNHTIKFGLGDIYHTFRPGVNTTSSNTNNETNSLVEGSDSQFAHEAYLYIEDEHKISKNLKINYGIHHSSFFVGDKIYNQLQPRISGNLILTDNSSLKFGYSRTAQFLHLLSNTGIGLPTDLWVPATEKVSPVTADQISLGYNHEIKRQYNFVIEGYYKKMNNLIQYKEGASFFSQNTDWQSKVEKGQGWSYGGEILLEKKKGKFTGWIGYTLSWTERQFDNINSGEKFPYRYDRRHDISVVMTYQLTKTWDFGIVFVYGTGNAVTLASQSFQLVPNENGFNSQNYNNIENVTSINNYRLPAYHRMDIGANRTRKKPYGESVLSLSVYNVYNRQNAYFIYKSFDVFTDKNTLKQVSIFPIIPSISWKFKFNFEQIKENKLNKKKQ